MASYATVEDWQAVERGYVLDVTIRRTDDERYPCGWDYSLHLGEVGGDTIRRYDNAHERTKGHECHTPTGTEIVEFPGMLTLYDQFESEVAELTPVSWNWPEEP